MWRIGIYVHLWHHHHHQSNKTNPTLPEVSCVPLFLLFVVRTLTMRSTLLTKFEGRDTICTMGFVIQSIFYLELEDQRMYFQILLQLIRGSSFNSGVRNEILILKKKLSSDLKKVFFFIFGCAGSSLLGSVFSSFREQGLLASCGAQASHCDGWLLLLLSMGSRARGLQPLRHMAHHCSSRALERRIVVAHKLSYPEARGIFPDQGSNPRLLYWQVNYLPRSHQGSSHLYFNFLSWVVYFFQLYWGILDKYNCTYLKYMTWWFYFKDLTVNILGFPGGSVVKNLPGSAGDTGSISGLGGIPWRRKCQPTSIFLLENSMDGGAWLDLVHGIVKSHVYLFISQQ